MAKEITLSKGFFAIVDDSDYEWLNQWKWSVQKKGNTYYAHRNIYTNRKGKNIYMHRLILSMTNPKILCDHVDHNGLNNQRSNLRIATASQNLKNRQAIKNRTSKYLGVSLTILKKKVNYTYWEAGIGIGNGKRKFLGYFKTEEDAALAYNEAAKMYHGEFANLNIVNA